MKTSLTKDIQTNGYQPKEGRSLGILSGEGEGESLMGLRYKRAVRLKRNGKRTEQEAGNNRFASQGTHPKIQEVCTGGKGGIVIRVMWYNHQVGGCTEAFRCLLQNN